MKTVSVSSVKATKPINQKNGPYSPIPILMTSFSNCQSVDLWLPLPGSIILIGLFNQNTKRCLRSYCFYSLSIYNRYNRYLRTLRILWSYMSMGDWKSIQCSAENTTYKNKYFSAYVKIEEKAMHFIVKQNFVSCLESSCLGTNNL